MPQNRKSGPNKTNETSPNDKDIIEPQEIIKALPKGIPKDVKEKLLVAIAQYQFVGPLPPPGILEGYSKIDKSFPERIVKMAEKEQKHRHIQQKKHLNEEIEIIKYGAETERIDLTRGQIFGFCIGIIAIIAGAITAILGQPIVGGFIGFGGVAGLVSVFILGRGKQVNKKKENKEKEKKEKS